MYSSSNESTYQFPPEFRIRNQAKFLVKKLSVTLGEAQEMISYYYQCNSWSELMSFASIAVAPPELIKNYDSVDASDFRNEIQKLISSGWKSNINAVKKLALIPHSVSHSIANNNLESLYDEEIIALHYHIFEGEKEPQYDIYEALSHADNSILTHIRHRKNREHPRGHLTDHRYGFTMYYMLQLNGNSIRLIIRELDTLFSPPSQEHTHFKKEWFVKHTHGYLKHLINCLEVEYTSGEVVLHRVYNHDCIVNRSSNHQHNPHNMNSLGEYLISQGGIVEPLLNKNDTRLGITLAFSNN
jgi:hypothetical protein